MSEDIIQKTIEEFYDQLAEESNRGLLVGFQIARFAIKKGFRKGPIKYGEIKRIFQETERCIVEKDIEALKEILNP